MSMNAVRRPLRVQEKALLDFLLSADFPGREELKEQAENVTVVGECQCGCGTVQFQVDSNCAPAKLENFIPIEAYGEMLDVLLFAGGGFLKMLEIVFYGDPPKKPYPRPEQLKLGKRNAL
jgi:hypothetical protein